MSEAWRKQPTLVADWEFWQVWADGEAARCVADFLTEEDADQIIADHNATRVLGDLAIRVREWFEELDNLGYVTAERTAAMRRAAHPDLAAEGEAGR